MKKVFFFMALAVAGLAMTACGGNKEDDKKDAKIEVSKDSSIETDAKAYAQVIDKALKADKNEFAKVVEECEKVEKKIMEKYGNDESKAKKLMELVDKEIKSMGKYESAEEAAYELYRKSRELNSDMRHESMSDENDYNMSDMDMSEYEDAYNKAMGEYEDAMSEF